MARSSPTRSSVVKCSDTSGKADAAVSVAIYPFPLNKWRRPGSPGGAIPEQAGSPREPGIALSRVGHGQLALPLTMVESVFWPRLRWRMRGAWQWPAFAALTVVDALLVARLPFQGDGPDAIGALLVAGFANLLVVAVLAPLAGLLVRRWWRPDLPRMIARDYAGTVLLGLVTIVLVTGGLIHRPGRLADEGDRAGGAPGGQGEARPQGPGVPPPPAPP